MDDYNSKKRIAECEIMAEQYKTSAHDVGSQFGAIVNIRSNVLNSNHRIFSLLHHDSSIIYIWNLLASEWSTLNSMRT